MEKNIKNSAYLSITESFRCIAESNQYCKSTIHQLKKKKKKKGGTVLRTTQKQESSLDHT